MRFSRTVRRLKIRRPSGTCATPRETIAWGGTSRSDWSSSVMVPRDGWSSPEIVLSVVVLPAPLLPRIVTISPRPTSSPTPLSARISPYATSSDSTLSMRPRSGRGPALAEIGLDHPRVALDLSRWPLGDLLAVVQHSHAVGDLHDHAHVVLDQDDGEAQIGDQAAQEMHQVGRLALGHASGWLVEEQQRGLGRQRAGQLEAPPVAVRQVARDDVGAHLQSDPVEQAERA